jgi:hypothetical protein
MSEICKHKFVNSVIVTILSLAFTTAAFADAVNTARIIPLGKVSIIKDGQVVGEFSQETPLPEGSLLRCEDKCSVKMDDTYMVADGGTEFSLTPAADQVQLYVKTGTVYFAINESSRPIQITTPSGDATTGDLNMSEKEVTGYVRVSGNETEIGVIGGGTMMVETASGEMAVTPGNAVTITPIGSATSASASGEGEESTLGTDIALGAAGVAVLATGAYLLSTTDGNRSNEKSDGSPASP